MSTQSPLQQARLQYHPKLPSILKDLSDIAVTAKSSSSVHVPPEIAKLFPNTNHQEMLVIAKGSSQSHVPLRVGVVLSGGQAPGGHNVIIGLFDALKKLNASSLLFGFKNGPSGIVANKTIELTAETIAAYRNQGGFDLIGSGRTKIETNEQFEAADAAVRALDLDGLVVIGGDDSNTNAAFLAERFKANGNKCVVIGVPKTIDGDLKNSQIEISFGFDTACKTYADIIGNLTRDALSAKKYYNFIKLMGRSASHITLECALQTHPNLALISEEVEMQKKTLSDIISDICDVICERAKQKKDYGVILIPEGLIEFIPEVKVLIGELNKLLADDKPHGKAIEELLSPKSQNCFQSLPKDIQDQLLIGRDDHGNVQVSKIETERLFVEMVKKELKVRAKAGTYTGKFSPQPFFCGYEGRACLPSNFDSNYCCALGYTAAILVDAKASGYICCVKNLTASPEKWELAGVPLTSMMTFEMRHGEVKPVIQKALVNLKGKPFETFASKRKQWAVSDEYSYPGPIQFFGPAELTDNITNTLKLESL